MQEEHNDFLKSKNKENEDFVFLAHVDKFQGGYDHRKYKDLRVPHNDHE
jgi:hypothetical protein